MGYFILGLISGLNNGFPKIQVEIFIFRKRADCDQLIEIEDMIFMGNRPDAKCMFCYLQSLYNKLKKFEKKVEKHEEVDV